MTTTLIIGVIFLSILLIFLFVSFFFKADLSESQFNTLHFLTALCGGFAGGFLTGETLLQINGTMSNGLKFGISGTAGFAIFILIWFTYRKYSAPKLRNSFNFSIPDGWTFLQASQAIAQAKSSSVSFLDFSQNELNLMLTERSLNENSAIDALKKLKALNRHIPNYTIEEKNNTYIISKT